MIRNKIATFILFTGIIISILGWVSMPLFMILGYFMILLSPFIKDEKYEYNKWKEKYLTN